MFAFILTLGRSWLASCQALVHRALQRLLKTQATYEFQDSWLVSGVRADVADLLSRPDRIAEWWPQFLGVQVREAGTQEGLGRQFSSRVKGFLPYELGLQFLVDTVHFPEEFTVRIAGDFVGSGGGRLTQVGTQVRIEFDMQIEICRPSLRWLSMFLRPLMSLQHRLTMLAGEAALKRHLQSEATSSILSSPS